MSITSCPRCSQQVTLPPGVNESAKVRCPACGSVYKLADALVNVPPLLEVVEDEAASSPSEDWLDLPDSEAKEPIASPQLAQTIEFDTPPAEDPMLAGNETISFGEGISAGQAEGETFDPGDFILQDPDDGESEDQDSLFATSDPVVRAVPEESDPLEVDIAAAHPMLDFNDDAKSSGDAMAETLSFDAAEPAEFQAASDTLELDFGGAEEPLGATGAMKEPSLEADEFGVEFEDAELESAEIEFAAEPAESDDIAFELDSAIEFEPTGTVAPGRPGEAATLDFHEQQVVVPGPADAEDFELDFGEPVADVAAVAPVAAVPVADAKGKKSKQEKKEKKAKVEKAPKVKTAKAAGGRSLVGTLVNFVLPAMIALPVAYMIGLFISSDYDLLGIGPYLGFKKTPAYQVAKVPVTSAPPLASPEAPAGTPSSANAPSLEADTPSTPPADPATTEPAAAEATNPPAAAPAAELAHDESGEKPADANAPPAATVATDDNAPPAPEESSTENPAPAAADVAASEPAGDDLDSLLEKNDSPATDAADADMPAEQAAETPADGADADGAAADGAKPATPRKPAADPADDSSLDDLLKSDDPAAEPPAEEMPEETLEDSGPELAKPSDTPADEPAAEAAPEPAEPVGPRDARAFTLAELTQAEAEALQATERMTAAQTAGDEAEIKKARAKLYLSWYGLADVLTFFKDEQGAPQLAAERQKLRQAIAALASDPKRLDALRLNGSKWLNYGKRTTPGILLAGTVEKVEQVGPLYHVVVKPNASAAAVTVVSQEDPAVSASDDMITFGSIVEHPEEQLAGYQGSDDAVVWSGMSFKLPAR